MSSEWNQALAIQQIIGQRNNGAMSDGAFRALVEQHIYAAWESGNRSQAIPDPAWGSIPCGHCMAPIEVKIPDGHCLDMLEGGNQGRCADLHFVCERASKPC